jgi:hypothetical protein
MNNESGSDSTGTDEMKSSLDNDGNAVNKDPVYDLCHCSGIEPSLLNQPYCHDQVNLNQFKSIFFTASTSADFF